MKKSLKIIGYLLLGLIVLWIILGIILPKEASTSVTIETEVPSNYLYNVLVDPSIQSWNAFAASDSDIKYMFDGQTGVGSGYSWESDKLGNGKAIISEVVKDVSVTYDIYLNGEETPMTTSYVLDKGSIAANWNAHIGFPMNVLGPLFSWNVKKSLWTGINNLIELGNQRSKEGVYNGYQVNLVEVPEAYYVTNRSEVNNDNMQQFYSQNLSGLFRTLQEAGVETMGPDCALIYKYDNKNNTTDLAAALPVSEDIAIPNSTTVVLQRANAVTVDYYGNRASSQPAHEAIQSYMKDRELVASVPVIEEYVTDVLEEKNADKWLTKITYRIAE